MDASTLTKLREALEIGREWVTPTPGGQLDLAKIDAALAALAEQPFHQGVPSAQTVPGELLDELVGIAMYGDRGNALAMRGAIMTALAWGLPPVALTSPAAPTSPSDSEMLDRDLESIEIALTWVPFDRRAREALKRVRSAIRAAMEKT